MMIRLFVVLLIFMSTSLMAEKCIYALAKSSGNFKILLAAVDAAGLSAALQGEGKLTVFAPNDQAFGKLPDGTVEDLLDPANKQKLIDILKYHVLAGDLEAKSLFDTDLLTLQGQSVSSGIKDGQVYLGKAKLLASDIRASNGIIHVIDQVLLPSPPMNNSKKMTSLIDSAISKGVRLYNQGNHQACVDVYSLALESVLFWEDGMISSSLKQEIKQSLMNKNELNSDKQAWRLRKLIDRTYGETDKKMANEKKVSEFKPIVESAMPKGFPKPGPLNTVILKEYPAYRAARANSAGQSSTFMKLFFHIKKSNISMTAPVEMRLDTDGKSRKNMAFLYANQSIGELGEQGNGVEVMDLPAQSYLSYGIRGSESKQKIAEALEKIEAFLVDKNQWVASGEPRLLGYNSPMVPQENRYWEVQLPVKSK